ncbi:hypothetical protein HY641_04270 [Candidatus Woesearchaeota archaeon]|nr:hypothetical protein [Candidatus Woesearchaeota archaeon]
MVKLLIDTADLDAIAKAKETGLLDGVTTNPSLVKAQMQKMAKAGEDTSLSNLWKGR